MEGIMEEIKDILKQIDDFPQEIPQEEILFELKARSRDIGKKQGRITPSSEEYQSLNRQRELIDKAVKILQQIEREHSGLVVAGTSEKQKKQEKDLKQPTFEKDELYLQCKNFEKEYKKALEYNDIKAMQEIYRKVSVLAEEGKEVARCLLSSFYVWEEKAKSKVVRMLKHAAFQGKEPIAYRLLAHHYAKGEIVKENKEKAREYLDEAVRLGEKKAKYIRAYNLTGESSLYQYQVDKKRAFEEYKEYILRYTPLNMKDLQERNVLYSCYKYGKELGIQVSKCVPESLDRLLENEGEYSLEAGLLKGDILAQKEDYEEAIQCYLNAGVEGIYAIEELFFTDYFMENRQLQTKLDWVLEHKLEDNNAEDDIKAELYHWYGNRYEFGREKIQNNAKAYVYYVKAAELSSKYKNKSEDMLKRAQKEKDIMFLKAVIEEDCYTVAEMLGDLYQEKKMYEKALLYYNEGYENGNDRIQREICSKKYIELEQKRKKRELYVEESEPLYAACETTYVGKKIDAYKKLCSMAKKGNYYAMMRAAQVSETDTFIQANEEYQLSDEQIFCYYLTAANEGEDVAIQRMVEIYTNGEYGQPKSDKKRKEWEQKLG